LKLGLAARAKLAELIAGAGPLKGNFFRSVAFRYFHPDDLISGEGTRLNGGRFVPVGVPAVYGSMEEETAFREVTVRKGALGGRSQIKLGDYPRMTYVLAVSTRKNLDLTASLAPEIGSIVLSCLRARMHAASQALSAVWIAAGIESVVFPSATGAGRNVVVYLRNAAAGSIVVRNRDQVLAALRGTAARR
jgi:RES domain-containing protein